MEIVLTVSIVFQILNKLVNGISIGRYVKTKTIIEKPTCRYDDVFNEKMKTFADVSMIVCGILCTSHPKCRRFMYNEQSGICSLFQAGENCIVVKVMAPYSFCYRQKSICNETICTRCPMGYYGDECENIIEDCSDGLRKGVVPEIKTLSYIQPAARKILEVKCLFQFNGWTYVQYRTPHCSKIHYNRTWNDYAVGFGDASGNYWLGLEHIHNIVKKYTTVQLLIFVVGDTWHQCHYHGFRLEDESTNYKMIPGIYVRAPSNENALGDVLTANNYDISGQPFSTKGKDVSGGCSTNRQAGWWYLPHPTCSPIKVNKDEIQWLDRNNAVASYKELNLRLNGS